MILRPKLVLPNDLETGDPVDYAEFPVLYVDDEPANLVTFRFAFEDQFRILTTTSGEEALDILASEPVAVLLADQRMEEGLSGTELCVRACAARPEAIRIIVTAFGDLSVAVDAINLARVSRFILKPWQAQDMAIILQQAIETFRRQANATGTTAAESGGPETPSSALVRHLVDPATALRHNLEWSVDKLAGLAPTLETGPRPVRDTYRMLTSALEDSREAAVDLCEILEKETRREK